MLTLISYDLKKGDKDYAPLYEAIKALGDAWWHYMESVWIVHTDRTASQCRVGLRTAIDDDDTLFVCDITGKERDGWLPSKAWEWLKNHDK